MNFFLKKHFIISFLLCLIFLIEGCKKENNTTRSFAEEKKPNALAEHLGDFMGYTANGNLVNIALSTNSLIYEDAEEKNTITLEISRILSVGNMYNAYYKDSFLGTFVITNNRLVGRIGGVNNLLYFNRGSLINSNLLDEVFWHIKLFLKFP